MVTIIYDDEFFKATGTWHPCSKIVLFALASRCDKLKRGRLSQIMMSLLSRTLFVEVAPTD